MPNQVAGPPSANTPTRGGGGVEGVLPAFQAWGESLTELRKSYTNADGRCPGLLTPEQMTAGTYKLFFDTEGYWKKMGQTSFYPYVEVVFTITNEAHKLHVPLLLSPFSYTTYRGS
ncbi:5-hydroxyisourate hydrolase-like [Sarcophilus harrisii]|uniref:5-hydroxyisourate hydrolase-like n=1 Tax=Sarcophilus harrisii TaxID=9305 RepID=UPI001301F108|nr:5-hydroxyisourate hydrolase-like [Sarcophilus harrisii]